MNWSIEWSEGVSLKSILIGIFKFQFPEDPGHINSISCPWNKSLNPQQAVTFKYRIKVISGKPMIKSLDDTKGLAPNFRPMLFTGDWYDPNARWWPSGSNCAFLKSQDYTDTYFTSLSSTWSNVNGKVNPAAYKAALKKVNKVYLAFGGGNSFSHGLCIVGGKLRFDLLSFSIK